MTQNLQERLWELKCDPLELAALIARNDLPCGTCRGVLKTKYKIPNGGHGPDCPNSGIAMEMCPECENIGIRTCESCYGSGWEKCDPTLRGKMVAELMQYIYPKRKAVEVSGIAGAPLEVQIIERLAAGRKRLAEKEST